tara:strand:+ start:75074 stop:75826 length:753 start_codon:yes stop_codon:yes gene_type:complete
MSKLIKIYGERNTNTNYMSELIRLNLDIEEIEGVVPYRLLQMQNILPGEEWLRDAYFYFTCGQNLGWKHTCVKSVDKLRRYSVVQKNQPAFLTITKNPYSWLLSLHRRPYHQYYSKQPDLETFLGLPWKTVGRDNTKKWLQNPVELWNLKNRSYQQLLELNAMNITTEQIFENPEAIVDKVSARFSVGKKSDKFINFERSTKDKSKDSNYYRDYYLNERWREKLSDQAITMINDRVDKDLMAHFGYQVLS